MRVKIDAGAAKTTLARLKRASALSARYRPLYEHARIEAGPDGVIWTVIGEDLSARLHVREGVQVETPGVAVVHVARFAQVLARANGDITVESDDAADVLVRSQGFEFELRSPASPDEFEFLQPEPGGASEVPIEAFRSLILQAAYAADREPSNRPILLGIHLTRKGGVLRAETTDTYRAAVATVPSPGNDFDLIVPASAVHRALELLPSDGTIQITADDRRVQIESSDATIILRALVGHYPELDRVFPTDFRVQVDFSLPDLIAAVSRARVILEQVRNRPMVLHVGGGESYVHARSFEGEYRETLRPVIIRASEEDAHIALNALFVHEALQAIAAAGADRVSVGIAGPLSPVIFAPVVEDGTGAHATARHVIVPIRIQESGARSKPVAAARR